MPCAMPGMMLQLRRAFDYADAAFRRRFDA